MSFAPLPLEGYLDKLAGREPTPGGGTAAAVAGATAAALAEMVLGLTLGRAKYAAVEPELAPLLPRARALRATFLRLADDDSAAYDGFVQAGRMPKATPEEQAARDAAMRAAALRASEVPLATAQRSVEALEVLAALARKGNPNARSDAVVGALHAWVAYQGARLNVEANLPGLGDPARAQALQGELAQLGKRAEALLAEARGVAPA